jgi:hypothetical protein
MKKLILFILLCLPAVVNGQIKVDTIKTTDSGVYVRKTGEYISPNGAKFKKGDYVLAGASTGNNGEYKYLYSGGSLYGATPLKPGWEGSKFKIQEIKLTGSKEFGNIVVFRLGNANFNKYFCTADGAFKSGELKPITSNQ